MNGGQGRLGEGAKRTGVSGGDGRREEKCVVRIDGRADAGGNDSDGDVRDCGGMGEGKEWCEWEQGGGSWRHVSKGGGKQHPRGA